MVFSVLFVCLGNICRSPMAEAVFRDLLRNEGLENEVLVDSVGIRGWHVGKPPHEGTREVLEKHGISWDGLLARKITDQDLNDFDLIVGMDEKNLSSIKEMIGTRKNIYLLTDFISEKGITGVPDPFHTGQFEETYKLVEAGCKRLLDFVKITKP